MESSATLLEPHASLGRVRFQAQLLDAVGQAVIATDLTGTITYWNRAAEALYGWAAAEALGRNLTDVTPTLATREHTGEIVKSLQAGQTWSGEFTARRRDGSAFPAKVTNTPIFDDGGNLVGIVGLSVDLTEQKRTEQTLRDSEQRSRAFLGTLPDLLFRMNRDGEYLDLLAPDPTILPVPPEDILGHSILTLLPSDVARQGLEGIRLALDTKEVQTLEYELSVRENDVRRFEARIAPVSETEVVVIARDVTKRGHIPAEVLRENARLQYVFEHSPAFVCIRRGPNHVFESINPAYFEMIGRRDVVGKPVGEALPELARQGYTKILDDVYQTGEPFAGTEVPIQLQRTPCAEPETRYIDLIHQPLKEADGTISGIFSHGVDVTEQVRARKAVEQTSRAAAMIMDNSLDVICTIDRNGHFVRVSAASERIWGYASEELTGMPVVDLIHPEDRARTLELSDKLAAGQNVVGFENRYVRRDGTVVQMTWSCTWSEKDQLAYAVGRDVTDLKTVRAERAHAKAALQKSDAKFRGLVQNSSEIITLLSGDGTIQYQSPSITRILGYTPDELEGISAFDLVHPNDQRVVSDVLEQLVANGGETETVFQARSKSGEWRWLESRATNLLHDDAVRALVVSSRDVTERRQQETLLRQRDVLLQTAAEVAQILTTEAEFETAIQRAFTLVARATNADRVYVFENHRDPASGVLLTSQRFEWAHGPVSPQIDNPDLQNLPVEAVLSGWAESLANGEPVGYLVREAPETLRPYLVEQGILSLLVVPIMVDGEWFGVIGLDDCTTERVWTPAERAVLTTIGNSLGGLLKRKRTDEAIQESGKRLRMALEAAQMGTWDWNLVQGKVTWSDQTYRLLGLAEGEFDGQKSSFMAILHPADRDRVERESQHAIASVSGMDIQYRIIRPDGEIRWMYSKGSVYVNAAGKPVRMTGTVMDVTDRRRAEEALRASEAKAQRLAMVASRTTNGVIITDDEGRIEWVNDGHTRISGYTLCELQGKQPWETVSDEDGHVDTDALQDLLARRESFSAELPMRAKDGRPYWIHLDAQPLYSDGMDPAGFMAIETDVTEHKRYELELLKAKEQAEEMVRLKSAFLANMSHEIRTPLTSIIGFAEILKDELADERLEFVQTIYSSGQRLLETLNSVLDLAQLESRTLELCPSHFDLASEAQDILEMFHLQAAAKSIRLNFHAGQDVVEIVQDRSALSRVLTNLVSNAVKFTQQGEVAVRVERQGPWAVVQVRDTGIGMSSEFVPHLFDEFRQESSGEARAHEGSGLGLAITKRLLDLMGGAISVQTQKGEGTAVTVKIPLQVDAFSIAEHNGQGRLDSSRPNRPRVLVVEDSEETLALIQRILSPYFDVDVAAAYATAVELGGAHTYDTLLIDIHLGGGESGIDLLRALREQTDNGSTPAIACTAFALPGDRDDLLAEGFDAYLSKPFRRAQLIEVLGSMMQHDDLASIT